MWCIYKHTSPTGKSYIGQTEYTDLKNRWGKQGEKYQSQTWFYSAILLWGWDNLTHEILEDNIPTLQEANKREAYWIKFYNSFWNGYNMRPQAGGDVTKKHQYAFMIESPLFELFSWHLRKTPKLVITISQLHEFNIQSGDEFDKLIDNLYTKMIEEIERGEKI